MPISKSFLPDVNVWLALASRRHIHHVIAAHWFQSIGRHEAAFCRITQLGFLRLLTNHHAMGIDVVGQVAAWQVYWELTRDYRVRFVPEPVGLEERWEQFTQEQRATTNLWTDAYLAALAQLRDLCVVSFDHAFNRRSGAQVLLLR
jgi:toxin-antitoxin system PIN domain toxin